MKIYLQAIIPCICCSKILRKSGKVKILKIAVISWSLNVVLNSLEGDLSAGFSCCKAGRSNCCLLPQFYPLYPGISRHCPTKSTLKRRAEQGVCARPQVLPLCTRIGRAFPSYSSGNRNNWKQFRNTNNVSFFFWGLHISCPLHFPRAHIVFTHIPTHGSVIKTSLLFPWEDHIA